MNGTAIGAAAALLLAALPRAAAGDEAVGETRTIDVRAVTRAFDTVRFALPEGWEIADIRWDTVPDGWIGDPACVRVHLRDASVRFENESGGFKYHPFRKLWFLPPCWEGRMEVADLDADVPRAVLLGEAEPYRVLHFSLGRDTWPEGPEVLAAALSLDALPLTGRPAHTLDVRAMQRLFQRLDSSTGGRANRWQRQIYGIAELPGLVYVELLTWDERPERGAKDPTWLGDLAEKETRYLSREALAAFPGKRGLYLRRVTNRSYSDVIVVNPAKLAVLDE